MDTKELINEISKYFLEYLERPPNEKVITTYLTAIQEGTIKINDLPNILKNSNEYKDLQLLHHGCIYTKYGNKMYLDKNDQVISERLAKEKIWEEEETKFLSTVISDGMNVVDLGAHIGYYTLLFSRWVGVKGKIFSFEPDPENYRLLKKNIAANQIRNVVPIQKAVSNRNGKSTLFLSDSNKGDHRINDFYIYDGDDKRKKIEVRCVTLDTILENESLDFIKMDIQGAENLAFDGMSKILSKNSKLSLLIEFWPAAIEKLGFLPSEFIERIFHYGFSIFSLEGGKKEIFSKDNPIITKYSTEDSINLFCQK